ncbi:MAG: DUF4340 domain-containing protein [Bacteroidetes bacterium]|nr:DUF4340 domain-containing protein [Bacteroidota bacterium]
MRKNRNLILGVAFVLLALIAWISGVFDQNPSNIQVPEVNLPIDEVTQMSVALPDSRIELEKEGGQWFVRQPIDILADSSTVSRALNELGELSLNNRVTSNESRYGIYGIDSTATTVTLSWPDGSEEFVISRQGRDFSSIFVRIGDRPEIYATNGRVTINQDPERWRNRMVINPNSGMITSARVVDQGMAYEVSLINDIWMVDDQVGDSLVITNWLRRFSPLNADGFFDDLPPQILSDANYRLDLTTNLNTTLSLQAMPAESDVALIHSGKQYTYRIFESRLDQLFPDRESLIAQNE